MSNDTYLDVLHQAHSSLQTEKDVLELGSGEDDESETGQPKVKIEGGNTISQTRAGIV